MTLGRAIAEAPVPLLADHDVTVEDTQADALAWIEGLPRGAYTTARTVDGGRKVFRLSMHVQRLHESARDLIAADTDTAAAPPLPPLPSLRSAAERVMARAVRHVRRGKQQDDEEVKLTLLLTWPTTATFRLHCHAQALPSPPRPPTVRAVACGQPRRNARAKDSAWVRERRAAVELAKRAAAALDAQRTEGRDSSAAAAPVPVEETLLVGESGALEEGASSNFFALTKEGVLQTAGEDAVLPGTVRAVVLQVARAGGGERGADAWPVASVDEGRAPRLAEAGQWRACFLSSTSRQLLPVDELLDATDAAEAEAAGRAELPVPRVVFSRARGQGDDGDAGVAALVAAVRAAILADSEPLPLEEEAGEGS